MTNGNFAHTREQEIQAYDEYVHQVWEGKRKLDTNTEESQPNQTSTYNTNTATKNPVYIDVTLGEVTQCYRKCRTNKAMKTHTRPAEALHIASDILAPEEIKLWKAIGLQRQYPEAWRTSDIALIPKPGKDFTLLINRRGINKIDSGLKTFSIFLQSRTSEKAAQNSHGEWGVFKHKSTAQPLLIIEVMMQRARKAKKDFCAVAGDIEKAFDYADHAELAKAIAEYINVSPFCELIIDRHCNVVFRFTLSDGSTVEYMIPRGAVQGCSLGPMAFAIYYRRFLHHLETLRTPAQRQIMHFTLDTGIDGRSPPVIIEAHKMTFVDDHIEMWVTEDARELREALKDIIPAQQKFKLQSNFKKMQIMWSTKGKNSRKRKKSIGNTMTIGGGQPAQIQQQIKYLGCIYHETGSAGPEVDSKIASAKSAHARLTRHIYRNTIIPTDIKIELFQQYELTILLNGLECRNLTKTQITKLERYQIRAIRHLTCSPAHITFESNEKLRKRTKVPTIESRLQRSRLNNLRTFFRDTEINQQLIGVMFGKSPWDPNEPDIHHYPYIKQMHTDIITLYKLISPVKNMLPITWSQTHVNHAMRQWVADRTHSEIDKLFRYTSETEQHYKKERARQKQESNITTSQTHTCQQCGKAYSTEKAKRTHQMSAHGYRNPLREQVTTNKCPGCSKTFVNINGAKSHWAKQICVEPESRASGIMRAQEPMHEAPPIPHILSFFQ